MDPDARHASPSAVTSPTNAASYPQVTPVTPPTTYSNPEYTVPEITHGEIYNRSILGGTPIGGGSKGLTYEGQKFAGNVIKFRLTLPDNSFATRPEYSHLFKAYSGTANGFHDGNSFILYALVKDVSEAVEQAVTMKRTKGGYLENHWGTRPSIIQASGQVGLFLSSVGLTPFQVEDPNGDKSETVLFWDPTSTTVMLDQGIVQASSSNAFNNGLEQLANKGLNFLGSKMGGAVGGLLSTANASGYLAKNSNHPSLPSATASQAASPGTNLAFRNFRLILDLFKHNGIILDSLPNVALYPSTFTAGERYAKPDGTLGINPPLMSSSSSTLQPETLFSMSRNSLTAPGNVLAVLPIEMYIKDTKYTGFFQNFNYTFSEDNPYSAFYDFTFVAKVTERTAVFFTSGTSGRRPFSLR